MTRRKEFTHVIKQSKIGPKKLYPPQVEVGDTFWHGVPNSTDMYDPVQIIVTVTDIKQGNPGHYTIDVEELDYPIHIRANMPLERA